MFDRQGTAKRCLTMKIQILYIYGSLPNSSGDKDERDTIAAFCLVFGLTIENICATCLGAN